MRRLNAHGYALNFGAVVGGVLQVSDYFGQGSTIVIFQSGPNIVIQDNGIQELFPIASISSIIVHGNDGNDIIRMESDAGLPASLYGDAGDDFFDFSFGAHNLSNITGYTSVFGGTGSDSVFVYDNSGTAGVYSIDLSIVSRNGGFGGLFYGSDVEGVTLTTSTLADTVNVLRATAGTPLISTAPAAPTR